MYKPRLKRFKAFKIRVKTKSTSGKKITRNVRVKATNFCSRGEGAVVKNSPSQNDVFLAEENDMSDCHGDETGDDAKKDRDSKYLLRRVREYSSFWENMRQSLLQAQMFLLRGERKLSPLTRCASNVSNSWRTCQ